MNVAAIAMCVNLNNHKPMAHSTNSNHKRTFKIYSNNSEDDSPPLTTSTVDAILKKDEDVWGRDFQEEDGREDEEVGGAGLILYTTPTATKAPYWKRRLGWKPNMCRVHCHNLKNLFRVPVRRQATVGQEGDALLLVTKKPNQTHSTSDSAIDGEVVQPQQLPPHEHQRQWEPEKEYVVDHDHHQVKDKGWSAFHAEKHELVFV